MWPHLGGQGLRVGNRAGRGSYPSGSSSMRSLGLFSERGGPTGRMHSFIPLPESLPDPHGLRFRILIGLGFSFFFFFFLM